MDKKVIENNFTYHAPTQASVADMAQIRAGAKELALFMEKVCPDGRELSLALTKLEESIMWANAGIVRYDASGDA